MLHATVDELPHATAKSARIFGKVRERPEDFQVEEVPAYLPTGTGGHLFVRFRKTDLTTPQAVRSLAQALGADPRGCGWAGLKDKKAVTVQWASFPDADPARALALELPGIQVLEAVPHGHKLRTGQLRGNRFRLLLRDAGPSVDAASVALAELGRAGVPNYYGEQRFGPSGENLRLARRWVLEGGPAPRDRFRRKLLLSVLQSALFNEWLAERLLRAEFDRAVPGDLMRKEETGGQFICQDTELDTPRMQAWEISPTGPMFGAGMRPAEARAAEIEQALRDRWSLTDAQLAAVKKSGEGTRRVSRVRPTAAQAQPDPSGLWLEFSLPAGAYATVVLRELLGEAPGQDAPDADGASDTE
jgi:tRNA pseudouridine13 synthase